MRGLTRYFFGGPFLGRGRYSSTWDVCTGFTTIRAWWEVYDYVDPNVRMLARMYDRRLRGYADMGYKISKNMAVGAG